MKTHGIWKHRALVVGIHWWSALVLVACPGTMALGQATKKWGITTGPKPVRFVSKFRNDSGEPAHDFDATISSKCQIVGGSVFSPFFPTIQFTNHANKSYDIRLSGGTLPKGEKATIRIATWLHDANWNDTWLDWYWTDADGKMIGNIKRATGFNVDHPKPGGNGGMAANQGGGGGFGNFTHDFTIANNGDEPLLVSGISYFATMSYVNDIDSLPWNTIPGSLASPITLQPNEQFTIPFETMGSYGDGELLFKVDSGQETLFYGAHPVPVPEPGTWATLAGLCLVGFAASRRLRAIRSPC